MSTKQSPMLNDWLTIGSIAFGVSCGCTLPFTQNPAQSALIGLATIPGVAASAMIRSRQRQRQANRQVGKARLRLNELQQRGSNLNQQLQTRTKDCQEIESRVLQLNSLAANLDRRVKSDLDRHQQLEQQLVVLDLYYQEQQNLSTKLDRKIQSKQAHILELEQASQIRCVGGSGTFAPAIASLSENQSLELSIQDQKIETARKELELLELALHDHQADLDKLDATSTNQRNQIEVYDRELKTVKLELNSRRAELDNLEFQIHTKLQRISEIDLEISPQALQPQPPTISRSIDEIEIQAWAEKFIDNPHLPILQHIDKHGTITETEASSKLGNARSVRQFANKLEKYAQDLPFAIRVESSPKGNRYLKETQN